MTNRKLLLSTLVSAFFVLVIHLCAMTLYWYWKYWWFDNIVHFAGGATIALFTLFYLEHYGHTQGVRKKTFIIFALLGTLLAAVAWEIFEYKTGITKMSGDTNIDTFTDILVGLFGALVGALYAFKIRLKNE